MNTAKKKKSKSAALRIEGECNIYRAGDLKDTLLEWLEQPGPLEIDLSGVTELDTAGVQLLMLAKKVAQGNQRELTLSGHSAAVLDVFELLNLAGHFGDQIVIPTRAGRT